MRGGGYADFPLSFAHSIAEYSENFNSQRELSEYSFFKTRQKILSLFILHYSIDKTLKMM